MVVEGRSELVSVLDKARARGARAAEAYREAGVTLTQTGARARPTTEASTTWRVRVYRDGGHTGVGTAPTAAEALDRAIAAAEVAPADGNAGPIDRMPVRAGGMGIDDRRHAGISEEDREELLHLAERPFERGPVTLADLRYTETRVERAWLSTRGAEAGEFATTYMLTAVAVGAEGRAAHRIASRHFSDVASLPFGTELKRRIEPLLRAESPPPGTLPVVLDPRVLADLVRSFAPAFTAPAVEAGVFTTPLQGRRLASPVLHLTDDAGLFGGLHSRSFDERGVPPIAVTLLKEGVVSGLYHDPESARARGLRPTGHVAEGQLRPSNLVVRPGARTRNVILTELGPHLVLDRLPPLDLQTGRLVGPVPVVLADRHDRKGAWTHAMDLPLATLLGALTEVAGDQERSCEVDAPSGVFTGIDLR